MSDLRTIDVPADLVRASHFPAICARHGGPATDWKKRDFYTSTPIWIFLLAIATLLIAAIVAMLIRKQISCLMPTCERCAAEHRRYRWTVAGLWVTVVGWPVLAVLVNSDAVFLLWFFVVLVALVYGFAALDWAGPRGTINDDLTVVTLRKVHPEFAGAIRAAGFEARPFAPPGYLAAGQP